MRRLAVAAAATAAAVLAGVAVAVLLSRGPAVPSRTRQARAMLPVIDAYLNSRAFQAVPGNGTQPADGEIASRLSPRWFCDAAIIEIRPGRGGWRAGTDVYCVEYARRGRTLLAGAGGDNGYYILDLSAPGGRYRVRSATGGQLVVPDPAWVRRHFSPRIAAELNSGRGTSAPLPARLARQAFGLPPGAPVISG